MKRIILIVITVLIVLIIPIVGLPVYACTVPDVYGETYLAAMADKYDRLHGIDGKKIILVGGSATAFGIDSAAVERELEMPVVNMSLYAALGSKTTLDLTKSGIGKGDIVVFSPEMDTQAYSLYTSAEIIVQTLEAKRSMVKQIPLSEWGGLFNELPNYITAKKQLLTNGVPSPTNAYSRSAFNEYGDNVYERKYNIMPELFLKTNPINATPELIDDEFIEYINDYARYVRQKGGVFYFTFPPMNRLALTEDSTYENRMELYGKLDSLLDCEIIGNIEDHIMNEGYFYDSNYHLNESGIPYNTKRLVADLKRQLGDSSPINIPLLPASGAEPSGGGEVGDDENAEYFEFEEDVGGYVIVSVKEEARSRSTLTLPRAFNGKSVYKIKAGAFSGCALTTLNVYENITVLDDGAFSGCAGLTIVNLAVKQGANDSLPSVGGDLLDGASDNLTIYVPSSKYAVMCTDYFWMQYASRLQAAS